MNKGKLIAGIVWLLAAGALILLLLGGIQRLLISGTELIDNLGQYLIEEEKDEEGFLPEEKVCGPVIFDDPEEPEPTETPEPEELVVIPVEQTVEELARENEKTE